ncbi:uncharacterized protein EAE97_006488 [Botrytis byssoidea]|uniref:Uncharacterized protein n=1 Tax=Botrytis byssoidea TaxID=139641 RepID=A0A9P5IPA0_9HELO|nr:uncharacterized protein EAE97_006488 [Botrytis byssoidea]KAF7941651.1 hypothetical protein EAE97_006488 [Botrytis byssoidea]
MSYQGSNAGRDRSVSHRGRDDNEYAPLPHHNDRGNGSIADYSRTVKDVGDGRMSTTSVRVRTRNTGPPISYNNTRYGNDGNGRSQSRNGSIRAPSVAFDGAARPASHRSESISGGGGRSYSPERHRPLQRKTGSHYGSQRAPSVSSEKTARPPIPRARGRDTDPQASDIQSYTSGQHNGYTSSHHNDRRSQRGKSKSELAGLSEQTESLNLGDPNHDRVARWSKGVESGTGGDSSDDEPPTELRSVNREGSNAPSSLYERSNSGRDRERLRSDDRYSRSDTSRKSYIPPPPGSFAADFPPNDTRSQSNALALQQCRDDHAPRKARSHRPYDHDGYASSDAPSRAPRSRQPYVAPARTSRNPPPPPHRGTYIERADYSQMYVTHETHETHIHAPDLSFMNEPSKSEKKRIRAHKLELERIRYGLRSSRGGSRSNDSESDSEW